MTTELITVDDLSGAPVRALLAEHLADMHATTPPERVFALDLAALRDPAVTVWTLSDDGVLLGCAALRELSPTHGEVKSMRTAAPARGRGVGSRLLEHVIGEARGRGYERLSLETGTHDYFVAARRLYERFGFRPCAPFGDYAATPDNTFFTLAL